MKHPFSSVFSNKVSETFPELFDYIEKNYYMSNSYKKNDVIQLMEREHSIYFILSGSVKSFICDDSGVERLMYIMLNDTVVFHSVHDYFMKTLIAKEPTVILAIRRKNIYQFLAQNEAYIERWEKIISSRYGILLQNLLLESHCSSKYKVYSFILQLADRYGQPSKSDANVIVIPDIPSITDIASITGTHRSNANTYINELRDQNLLRKEGSKLTITDVTLFRQIINALDQSNCNHSI